MEKPNPKTDTRDSCSRGQINKYCASKCFCYVCDFYFILVSQNDIYPTPLPFRRHFQAIEEPFVLLAVAASVGGEHAGAGRAREESPRSVQAKASPLLRTSRTTCRYRIQIRFRARDIFKQAREEFSLIMSIYFEI